MKDLIAKYVKPYLKFIAAGVGIAAVVLAPEDLDVLVGVLAALGVYKVPNVPAE